MKKSFRARALWLAGLLALAPVSFSQTMEIYAGQSRFVDAPGTAIGMQPGAMVGAPDGFVYVVDINGRLMRINSVTGLVTALPATEGGLNHDVGYSYGIAVDALGHPHVGAWGRLQRIETNGAFTDAGPLSGSGPMAFAPDGTLYFIVAGEHRVWARAPSGEVRHIAGGEESGYAGDGGLAANALLSGPEGIAVAENGDVYVSDTQNHAVRRISAATGVISTFAGGLGTGAPVAGMLARDTPFSQPWSLGFDTQGNLVVVLRSAYRIVRIDAASGLVSFVAGNGAGGMSGDGGPALSASIGWPRFFAFDSAGNLFFSDYGSQQHYVRRVDAATGIVSRAMGSNIYVSCTVTDVTADKACLGSPWGITIDAADNLLIADSYLQLVRKVTAGTRIMSNVRAMNSPVAVEVDRSGNLFVATWGGNYQVHRIDAANGLATVIYSGNVISDVATDAAGNVFLADGNTRFIHRIDAVTGARTVPITSLYAHKIEFDPNGDLIVGGNLVSCSLFRVNTTTWAVTRIAGSGSCSSGAMLTDGAVASGVRLSSGGPFAIEPDGNLLLAQGARLYRIDTQTNRITQVYAPGGGQFRTPEGLTLTNPSDMKLDSAGNLYISQKDTGSRNFIFRIPGLRDATPPLITPNVNGAAGQDGWYRSDVQVTWTVTDPESTVTSSTGCSNTSITEDTAQVVLACSATSTGGTATQSVTIKRDTVAPTVTFGDPSPAPDASGWYSSDVTLPFEAVDALSGVYSTSHGNPLLLTGSGYVTEDVVVTDLAGNVATFTSPGVYIDRTPPEVSHSLSGTLGSSGWYTSNVQVNWNVNEADSPVTSTQGCGASEITTDTEGVTFTCSVTSTGGTVTRSVTVRRDATPPQIQFGTQSPAPNVYGWNTTDVAFPYVASDASSGIATASSPSPLLITGEGMGLTAELTVIDAAGNSTTARSPAVNIERVQPTATPVITGTLGNEGWYRSDIHVAWTLTGNPISSVGCGDTVVTTDTAGITFTCTHTTAVGTVTNSVSVKRDATPPVLTWRTPTPAANAAGWNRANVSFPYNPPTDARSGVASVSAASPVVVSAEGTGVTASVTVTDRAGNSAVFTTAPRNIDKTAPTVTITSPGNNVVHGLYATAFANYSCVDAVSGVTSCTGTQPNGAQLNTRSMNGWYTFRVTGTDAAGNSFQRSHNWSVAGSFLFEGYLAPMQNDPTFNLVTAGSRVPMRFKLPDRLGGYVSDPGVMQSFTVNNERCLSNVVPLNDAAAGGAGLSFDTTTSTYTYNWDTSASWAGTCRNVQLRLIDGSRHTLMFKFQ